MGVGIPCLWMGGGGETISEKVLISSIASIFCSGERSEWKMIKKQQQTSKQRRRGKQCENIDVIDSPLSVFTAALPFSKQRAEFLCGLLTQTEIKQQLALLTYDTQNQT